MITYLSDTPIFFTPTRELRALDDKSIIITIPSGSETHAKLSVGDADPRSSDAGKCSVAVWQATVEDVEWVDAGSGQGPPTTQSHQWRRFLTRDAVKLITPNDDDPAYDFLLPLPTEDT